MLVKCSAGNCPSYRSCYMILPVNIVRYAELHGLFTAYDSSYSTEQAIGFIFSNHRTDLISFQVIFHIFQPHHFTESMTEPGQMIYLLLPNDFWSYQRVWYSALTYVCMYVAMDIRCFCFWLATIPHLRHIGIIIAIQSYKMQSLKYLCQPCVHSCFKIRQMAITSLPLFLWWFNHVIIIIAETLLFLTASSCSDCVCDC